MVDRHANKVAGLIEQSVSDLNVIVGALLGRPSLRSSENPLGPYVYVRELMSAAEDTDLGKEAFGSLLALFEKPLAEELGKVARQLLEHFARHGVDVRAIRRSMAVPRGSWSATQVGGKTALFFFAALEGLLALLRVRPVVETEDPYVGFVLNLPLYVEETQPDGTRLLVTARNKLAYFNPQQFPRAKPPGTLRIFCLGGSTTFGHPYDDRTSYPGWLREILNTGDPSRKWEVINAGGVSYASYREAALVQELARYSPDLFVVYSGHNEFLERRTYEGLLETHPSVTWLGSLAGRTRTYAVVRSAIAAARHDKAREAQKRYQMTSEVDALLDASVGPSGLDGLLELRRRGLFD